MGGSRDKPFTLRVESDLYLPQGTGSAVCCAEGLLDSAHYRREIHRSGPPMRKRDVKRFPVKNRVLPTGTKPARVNIPTLHKQRQVRPKFDFRKNRALVLNCGFYSSARRVSPWQP